jgi:hypothetical protein
MRTALIHSSSDSSSPAISASYSASLFVHDSVKARECRIISPSGVTKTSPTPARTVGTPRPAIGLIDEAPSKYNSHIGFPYSMCRVSLSGKSHFNGELS